MEKRTLFLIYYSSLLLFLLLDIALHLLHHPEPHFPWERIPGFHALFGFIGCFILILVSKSLGHYLLMREVDYYD
ncbi:MAG TPA: hypothetical protein ENG09_03945 [Candidatus Syntrophoarchaeum butanivorans]|nr:hypothetical protein [Candidatus Syntrophoarchaeum butanivorans]HEC56719.1 hypothetical protein [Candidatus Syntrophoarchaeum butanivorans]